MMRRVLYAILLLLMLPLYGGAQEAVDTAPMLYRGRVARKYPSDFNGTPYWDTLAFRSGTVMYNGRLYEDVLLRIDANEQRLLVREDPRVSPVIPDMRQLSWFKTAAGLFVNLRYQGVDAPEGFFQLVCDASPAVFRQIRKIRRSKPGNHNGREIGYEDSDYDDNLVAFYYKEEKWWVLENGFLTSVRGKKVRRIVATTLEDGSFSSTLQGWHPAEGTGVDLVPPSVAAVHPGNSEDLPLGYFTHLEEDALPLGSWDARYKNKVYEIGTADPGRKGKITVSGRVTDEEAKGLAAVLVHDEASGSYTRSDAEGRYSITLPAGENYIIFTDPEKEEQRLNVIVHGDGMLNVTLHEKSTLLNEAVISAESMQHHRTAVMGVEKISAGTMSKIPTVFGEGDVMKVVLTLPGVQTVGEASAGFNVRGGSTDQNLILFNGNTIYYPTHFFGINSVFNPDLVESMELYKGSIPAEFGGRISSVLDVHSKEGNPGKIKGSLGLGLITSRFHLEGPIVKNKTTFTLGGRTTYSDWILRQLPKDSEFSGGSAGFYDVNLGITHNFSPADAVQAFGYLSSDKIAFGADTVFRFKNANASLHWRHKAGDAVMKTSVGVDHYDNSVDESVNATEASTISTSINQVFARFDLKTVKWDDHTLNYGAEALVYLLQGGTRTPLGDKSRVIPDQIAPETALQPSLYLSDRWSPGNAVQVEGGVRLAGYSCGDNFGLYPELRLSGRWSLTPVLSFKGGFNTLSQFIHLISNTTSISPMDTWKMSDKDIPVTTGWQGTLGGYWTVFGGKLDLSVESYYKNLRNYIDYGPTAVLVMNHELSKDLVRTRGKAYGVEFMARKSVGRLNGWLSYTYSRSFLKDDQYQGAGAINYGNWYRASTDKPHDFKLVGNYAFSKRYSVSMNIDYSTGRPITLPVGYYDYAGARRLAYSARNAYRIPDYFRVDAAFNIDPGHRIKQLLHYSFTIGCYNITGRKNAYSVFFDTHGGKNLSAHMLSIFAVPVPYVNLNILF